MRRLALAFTIALFLPLAAHAERAKSCSTRANVLDHLANKYSESPVALGLANNGGVIEVLSSLDGKTWTIIITMPDGTSCMVAAGEAWEDISATLAKGPKV